MVAFLFLAACKAPTTGPQSTGTISGKVMNDSTGEPVAGVSITTNPATSAPATGPDGEFVLSDVEAGEYSVSAQKFGFENSSVPVSVDRNETTNATILLVPEEQVPLEAKITNFRNSQTSTDSVFAEVQYRVENPGQDSVTAYEVFFEFHMPSGVLQHEDERDDLRPGEADINEFRRFIGDEPADSVVITDVFF